MKQFRILIFSIAFFTISNAYTQEIIKWLSFEQAVELNQTNPKKLFIDVYTDWCGWCKHMDNNTFTNPVIIKYLNSNYYAVKLNAETKDTINYNGYAFINPNPTINRSTHQLAASLLNGEMSYPSYVFLDENMKILTIVKGFRKPMEFEPVLKYFGENQQKVQSWEDYNKTFKGEAK